MIEALIEQLTEGAHERPKFGAEKLAELKASNLARATASDVGLRISPVDGQSPEQLAEAIEARRLADIYFGAFLPVGPCPSCGRRAGFRWGMCYGRGSCVCGYPAQAHHNIEGVGEISNLILWRHPDELTWKPS